MIWNRRPVAKWIWTVLSAGFMGGVSSASSVLVLFQLDSHTFNLESDYNVSKVINFALLSFMFGFITHLFSTLQNTPLNFNDVFPPEEKTTVTTSIQQTTVKETVSALNENKVDTT